MDMKELGYYIFMQQQEEKKQQEQLKVNAAQNDHFKGEQPTIADKSKK